MNLLCLVGIHDWENAAMELMGRDVIVPRCRRSGCRFVDWQKAKDVPDRVVPAEPTPNPDVIRKGGMAEKPPGLPAKDPNTAHSGAEFRESPPSVAETEELQGDGEGRWHTDDGDVTIFSASPLKGVRLDRKRGTVTLDEGESKAEDMHEEIELGDIVIDRITGLRGTVTKCETNYPGCNRSFFVPTNGGDGIWFDNTRLRWRGVASSGDARTSEGAKGGRPSPHGRGTRSLGKAGAEQKLDGAPAKEPKTARLEGPTMPITQAARILSQEFGRSSEEVFEFLKASFRQYVPDPVGCPELSEVEIDVARAALRKAAAMNVNLLSMVPRHGFRPDEGESKAEVPRRVPSEDLGWLPPVGKHPIRLEVREFDGNDILLFADPLTSETLRRVKELCRKVAQWSPTQWVIAGAACAPISEETASAQDVATACSETSAPKTCCLCQRSFEHGEDTMASTVESHPRLTLEPRPICPQCADAQTAKAEASVASDDSRLQLELRVPGFPEEARTCNIPLRLPRGMTLDDIHLEPGPHIPLLAFGDVCKPMALVMVDRSGPHTLRAVGEGPGPDVHTRPLWDAICDGTVEASLCLKDLRPERKGFELWAISLELPAPKAPQQKPAESA